jgi:PAS domain S-box-containing protein
MQKNYSALFIGCQAQSGRESPSVQVEAGAERHERERRLPKVRIDKGTIKRIDYYVEASTQERNKDKTKMTKMDKKRLSFIPIPALIIIVLALYLTIKPTVFFEPTWLLPITNTVFVTLVCFIVAYIAMRNYKATGRIQILFLGCGLFSFGIGGVVAGWLRSVPAAGANLNVTIYNTGALIGAIFHFVAALILLAGISSEAGSKRKELWLVFSYVGLIVFMALFTIASLKGIIPPFFIQGVGPTILRQVVLGTAAVLFAFSFLIFMRSYLRSREIFLYWYSSALALTAISLTAFFIQHAVGSPIGWAGRFSQYLGGIYFFIAVTTAIRRARARRLSFDHVLTALLSPGQEKFRALAENSPDVIDRLDREMKHIYLNPAGAQLYGKPVGSIIGKTIEETGLPEAYRRLLKERIQKVFETGQPMEVEDFLPTNKDTRFYQSLCVPECGVDGTVANVLVVSRDLTDLKRAEDALHEASEQRRLALEAANLGTWDYHFDTGDVFWDEGCRNMWGIPRGDRIDYAGAISCIHYEDRAGVDEAVKQALVGVDGGVYHREFRVFWPDGSVHWISSHGRVYFEGEGELRHAVRFIGANLDITERRRMEEELLKSRDELELLVQKRTEELHATNEELKAENEERLRIEIELRESESHLRQLSTALLSAQERERKLIAQEIHDSMGASLAATKFKVETALKEMGDGNPQTLAALESVVPIIKGTIEEARRIQMSLRPSMLDDLGILATINWFCRQYESIYPSICVRKEIDIQEHEVPDPLKIVVYRVLQEALNNIAKHSKADRINLVLRKMDGAIELGIQDNGRGFDLSEAQSRIGTGRGLGLDSMRERAELSGGSFSIESSKGAGTVIRATWPVNR